MDSVPASGPVPVAGEPVVGWRMWNLSEDASGPRLWPAGSGGDLVWPPRRPVEARCTIPRWLAKGGPHEPPGLECRCGIYAARSLDVFDRERPAWPPPTVVGRASLWGRVVDHDQGWRARFAYPARLRLVCAMCAWLEPGPGVPAVVHAFSGRLYALCAIHRAGIEVPGGRRTRPTGTDPAELESRLLDAYAVDLLPVEPLEPFFHRPPAPEPAAYIPSIRVVPLGEERPPEPYRSFLVRLLRRAIG
jgi:hypothetical protein